MKTRQCFNCVNLLEGSDPIACLAFPAGIPGPILTGEFDHRQPYEGDDGFRFEPVDPAADFDDEDEFPREDTR
ncbi:MAG: hypothetical protein AB7Q81_24295 [Gammaproteobacteria bacterium]